MGKAKSMIGTWHPKPKVHRITPHGVRWNPLGSLDFKNIYVLVIEKSKLDSVKNILSEKNCSFSELGMFTSDQIIFESDSNPVLELIVDKAENNYLNSLGKIIQNG